MGLSQNRTPVKDVGNPRPSDLGAPSRRSNALRPQLKSCIMLPIDSYFFDFVSLVDIVCA